MPSFDNVLGTTLTGCMRWPNAFTGVFYWTAGQRIDPSSNSTFLWRTSKYATESIMTYSRWDFGQPDYARQIEACVNLWSGFSYRWNDAPCSIAGCSVCELDIRG